MKLFSSEAFAAVKVKNYRFFLAYRFFMTTATLMQSVIVGWQIYDLTKSVLLLGFIGLTEVIPQVCIALFAGHYIDIWNRKKIITYTSLLMVLGAIILTLFSIPSLGCYSKYGIIPIFVTIFITGISRGILMPAHSAFLGQLLSRKLYANAATWNSAVWHIAAVLGPAIGGLIYGFAGILKAYIVVLCIFVFSIILITCVKKVEQPAVSNSEEDIFKRIGEGIRFVFKNQVLLGAFSLDMFAVFFGGAVAMLPVFASDILKVGPEGLGILRASPAIGAILMSGYLMFHPPVKNTGKLLFYCIAGFGVCMIAFALSKNFWLSASILVLSGIFDNVSVVIRGTILQLFTTDEVRGRVSSVNSIFIGSSNELGAFESGVAAKLMGLIPSVLFGGIMTLLVVGITAKLAPTLRKLSLDKHKY
jgi:MFS family permease